MTPATHDPTNTRDWPPGPGRRAGGGTKAKDEQKCHFQQSVEQINKKLEKVENALGDDFTSYRVNQYEWDVWLQDEVEFGTLSSPFHSVDVIVDSIRDRGLDTLPENEWEGPNMVVQTWGSGMANSQDSFGNLEVTPPVTVNGVEYPLGRIYYGAWRSDRVVDDLRTFLDSQTVQSPFEFDVTWLCVGHVDEFITFIPPAVLPPGWIVGVSTV